MECSEGKEVGGGGRCVKGREKRERCEGMGRGERRERCEGYVKGREKREM